MLHDIAYAATCTCGDGVVAVACRAEGQSTHFHAALYKWPEQHAEADGAKHRSRYLHGCCTLNFNVEPA